MSTRATDKMRTVEAFHIGLAGADGDGAIPAASGDGLARWLDEELRRCGVADDPPAPVTIGGEVEIGAGWRAEIHLTGGGLPRMASRAESAGFDQPHHLMCRLLEFAALTLGAAVPEARLRALDDCATASPGAWLEWLAGNDRRALELDPAFAAPRVRLARALAVRGESETAAGLLAGVRVSDPEAAAELGLAFWALDQPGRALELLQAAVSGNPDDAVTAAALAALLARHGTEEARAEALLLATRATELAGNDYRCWAALADVHRMSGDFRQAGFFYGMALRLEPNAAGVLKDGAANWLLAQSPEAALDLIARGLALAPDDADHHGNAAWAHLLAKRPQPALAAARRAVGLRPDDARLLVLHGEAALAAGEREEALQAWARATELDPALLLNPAGGNLGIPAEAQTAP